LREALRLDPRFVQARLNLGSLQYRQRKKDEALRTYRDLLRIEPDHPQAQAAVRALSR
jgi:tetratricopeptide (TPR) repeat protein